MLKNDNHNSSVCAFESQIVSYLYAEINPTEKVEFESHVENCKNCADEIAAFSGIRSSIKEWREIEFSTLETPALKIPQANLVNGKNQTGEKTTSLFENLRNLFGFSNAWTQAAAAFAVSAVCFGLVFIIFNFSGGEDFAANQNKVEIKHKIKQSELPVNNVTTVETNDVLPKKSVEENFVNNDNSTEKKINENEIIQAVNKFAGNKIHNKKRSREMQPKKPSETQTANELKKPKAKPLEQEPKLTNFSDESEDDSLRLADLFDEVETR